MAATLTFAQQNRWGYGKTERRGGLAVHDISHFVGNCTGSRPASRRAKRKKEYLANTAEYLELGEGMSLPADRRGL